MARCEYTVDELFEAKLQRLGRNAIRQIVNAGAEACVTETRKSVEKYRHIVTGSMAAWP